MKKRIKDVRSGKQLTRFFLGVLSLLMLNALFVAPVSAQHCERRGRPLYELIAAHDAVVVAEKRGLFRQLPYRSFGRGVVADAKVLEIIKPPVVAELKTGEVFTFYPESIDITQFRGSRPMLMFINFVGSNIWVAERCRYLEITPGGLVRDVCNAVSDLFGEDKYERERRCLLNYPPAAPLADVRAEIRKTMPDGKRYGGSGRVMESAQWRAEAEYQTLLIQPDPRRKTEFFGTKQARQNSTIRVYLRTENLSEAELSRIGREGKRLSFEGFWKQGSFLVTAVEGT